MVTGSLVTSKKGLRKSWQKVKKEGWDGDTVQVRCVILKFGPNSRNMSKGVKIKNA